MEKSEKITLVGEAEDGLIGVSMAKELQPDVILMDIGLPGIDGITATKKIDKNRPFLYAILSLSNSFDDMDKIKMVGKDLPFL